MQLMFLMPEALCAQTTAIRLVTATEQSWHLTATEQSWHLTATEQSWHLTATEQSWHLTATEQSWHLTATEHPLEDFKYTNFTFPVHLTFEHLKLKPRTNPQTYEPRT